MMHIFILDRLVIRCMLQVRVVEWWWYAWATKVAFCK